MHEANDQLIAACEVGEPAELTKAAYVRCVRGSAENGARNRTIEKGKGRGGGRRVKEEVEANSTRVNSGPEDGCGHEGADRHTHITTEKAGAAEGREGDACSRDLGGDVI